VVASLKTASLYFLAASLCPVSDFLHCRETPQTQVAHPGSKTQVRHPDSETEPGHLDRPNKNDCIAVAEALYEQAETLSKRTKQVIPREFARVASNLDEACGEGDFDKAWISIEWMNTCLENFTKDYKLGFCSRNKSYFCAVDARSEGCLQSQ